MTITRRSFLAGTAATAAAVTAGIPAARAQSQTKLKFTLPWIPHGGYTHVFVAKKLGFWEKRGLDVAIDRGFGSGEVCKTLGLGQYDFGSIDFGVMTNCVGKGLDLVAIGMLSPRSPLGIFSLPKKGIRAPKDLEGKKLAFEVLGSSDALLWQREDAERRPGRQHADGDQVQSLADAVGHHAEVDAAEVVLAEPERLAHLAGAGAAVDGDVEAALFPEAELLGDEHVRVPAVRNPRQRELELR